MKKYRYSIIAGCCLALLVFMSLPATKTVGILKTNFFESGAPAAGGTRLPPSGYRLNLVPGSSKSEGLGSTSVSDTRQAFNKMPATQHNQFAALTANTIKLSKEQPVSTFSIDVDTASYSFLRTVLNQNLQPAKDAVRIEKLINYFPYDYPAPNNPQQPFKTTVNVLSCPWNPANKLLHTGIRGYQPEQQARPHANLVFLIDVSGSMAEANRLSLVQPALKMLLETLNTDDTVAIVTYADQVNLALAPTKAQDLADWQKVPEDARFSVAVAAFGQLLRGDPTTKNFTYDQALTLAQNAKGSDPFGYRSEFINLIRLAKALPVIAATH